MEKVDYKKEFDYLYKPSAKKFSLVTVPALRYLMIDGEGNPETSPDFQAAMEALYSVSYTLKFMSKKEIQRDYVVPPLEALWWAEDMSDFEQGRKENWQWTMMILVPEWIDKVMIQDAIADASKKKPNSKLKELRVDTLREGRSVQIMYVGPYDGEGPVLETLHHQFLPERGLAPKGKHHEIYLSDPRKTAPEKLRTVIRQPVKQIR